MVLYQKYTYEDVCRLLNWAQNEVPLNIGGYKFDKKTKTFPVFINYYSEKKDKKYTPLFDLNPQTACFASFVDKVIKNQTVICHNANEINKCMGNRGYYCWIRCCVAASFVTRPHKI